MLRINWWAWGRPEQRIYGIKHVPNKNDIIVIGSNYCSQDWNDRMTFIQDHKFAVWMSNEGRHRDLVGVWRKP